MAALPAPAFGGGALLGVAGLVNAATPAQSALGPGVAGAVNDLEKILQRLQQAGHDDPKQ